MLLRWLLIWLETLDAEAPAAAAAHHSHRCVRCR
jgi:hypothetical protein